MNSRRIHWLVAASLRSPSFVTAQSSTPFVEADFEVPEKFETREFQLRMRAVPRELR